jgi:deoxyribodipyrimidine photo-lyase
LREIDINADLTSLVEKEFVGLHSGGGRSPIKGGQSAADQALNNLNIAGYAKNRSEVLPLESRGASQLSP